MSYKELKGICKIAIEKGWCLGCNRLELESFVGVNECNYMIRRNKRKQGQYRAAKNEALIYT